jgi:hypothetical protein
MTNSGEALWHAWGLKFVEIVEAMEHRFTSNADGNMHFFHVTPKDELLQIITRPKNDQMTSVNLYGRRGSSQPVGFISLMGDEVQVGGHGMYHCFKAGDVPEFVAFVKRIRTKAMNTMETQSAAPRA